MTNEARGSLLGGGMLLRQVVLLSTKSGGKYYPFSLCKRDARDCRCHLDAKRRVKLRTEPIHQEGEPTELQKSRESGMPQCIVSLSPASLGVFCRSILTHAIITPWNVLVRKLGSVNALA